MSGDLPTNNAPRVLPNEHNAETLSIEELLASFRTYLMVMANAELSRDVAVKVAASDIVQETLLEAHADVSQFRGKTQEELLAWLRQILKHNILNAARSYRNTSRRQIARETPISADSSSDAIGAGIADPGPSPGSAVIQSEDEQRLLAALSHLPDTYRIVIELRNRDRLTFAEIGAKIDRSADAARKLWARAIATLRTELHSRNESE